MGRYYLSGTYEHTGFYGMGNRVSSAMATGFPPDMYVVAHSHVTRRTDGQTIKGAWSL